MRNILTIIISSYIFINPIFAVEKESRNELKTFNGFIDNKYAITMNLNIKTRKESNRQSFEKIIGYYYYDKFREPIKILGSITNDTIKFRATTKDAKQETFVGVYNGKTISGQWKHDNTKLSFLVNEKYDYDLNRVLAHSSINFPKSKYYSFPLYYPIESDNRIILAERANSMIRALSPSDLGHLEMLQLEKTNKIFKYKEQLVIISSNEINILNHNNLTSERQTIKLPFVNHFAEMIKDKVYFLKDEELKIFDISQLNFIDEKQVNDTVIFTNQDCIYFFSKGEIIKKHHPTNGITFAHGGDGWNGYGNKVYDFKGYTTINYSDKWTGYTILIDKNLDIYWHLKSDREDKSKITDKSLIIFGNGIKCFDLATKKLNWNVYENANDILVKNGVLYCAGKNKIFAIDMKSGDVLWFTNKLNHAINQSNSKEYNYYTDFRKVFSFGNMIYFIGYSDDTEIIKINEINYGL